MAAEAADREEPRHTIMLRAASRLAPRAGLLRRQQQSRGLVTAWAQELYTQDKKFWQYTAAVVGVVVLERTLECEYKRALNLSMVYR